MPVVGGKKGPFSSGRVERVGLVLRLRSCVKTSRASGSEPTRDKDAESTGGLDDRRKDFGRYRYGCGHQ